MTAGITFFLSSGLPFFTEARNMSPTEPAGKRFSLAPIPETAIMYKFLAPVLSAQFIVAATPKQFEILILMPLRPPLPKHHKKSMTVEKHDHFPCPKMKQHIELLVLGTKMLTSFTH